jgi:hypothetical protein
MNRLVLPADEPVAAINLALYAAGPGDTATRAFHAADGAAVRGPKR